MDGTSRRRMLSIVLVAGMAGCGVEAGRGAYSTPRETLRRAGRRLARQYSERRLTAMATRGSELLARLDHSERVELGERYLRFRADRPVVLDVAAPASSVPFWLADRGFRETDLSLENVDGSWKVFRKNFDAGQIGLGINGLDRTPSAHYVVFVRSLKDRDPVRPVVEIDQANRQAWRVVYAGPGVDAAFDSGRPFDGLPAELEGAVMLQPSHSARHSTMLAAGRVWKTHVPSGTRADQVVISYGSDPCHELVLTWRTSPDIVTSTVRILSGTGLIQKDVTRPPVPNPLHVIDGDSSLVEAPDVLNDPVIRRHRVVVRGLEPGQPYLYSLSDGTSEGWSPWRRTKTAPERGRPVRFLYLGDAQTGFERWGKLLEGAMRRNPSSDFVVLAGDIVDRGNERTNWDHFFLRAAPVLDRLPVMPCVGNHEYLDVGPRLYRAFFELPGNGPRDVDSDLAYSFEAGDACFAVMDSNLAVWDSDAARRQAEWLDQTLSRSSARWKIAIFHHPVYPSHPWRDKPALREHWVPVFDKHNVDLVLQGHDHSYQRTYPLRGHRAACGPDRGTTYVIAVSGDKFVDQARRENVAVGFTEVSTYQTIEIDPQADQLSYRAFTEDGQVVDEFEIDRHSRTSS